MAFSVPRAWNVGDEVTAALLNGISSQITQLQNALQVENSYNPVLTASTTNPSGYSSSAMYIRAGSLVLYWFYINLGSSVGSGYYQVSLPVAASSTIDNVGFTPSGMGYVSTSGFTATLGQWDIYTTGTAILRVATSPTAIENVTNSSPLALASGSTLGGTIIYPSA